MDAAARRALKVRNSRLQLDSPDRIEHLTIYTRICRAEKYQRQALRLGPEWNSGGTSCSLSSKIQNTGRRFPFSPDRNDSPLIYVCVYIHTHDRDTRVVEISLLVEGIYIYIGIYRNRKCVTCPASRVRFVSRVRIRDTGGWKGEERNSMPSNVSRVVTEETGVAKLPLLPARFIYYDP